MARLLPTALMLLTCLSTLGQLSFALTSDTVAYAPDIGVSGECTIAVENEGDTPIQLSIIRWQNEVAPDWLSAICTSVLCYPSVVDSVSLMVAPGTIEEVILYFQPIQNTSDTAHCLLGLRNESLNTEEAFFDLYAIQADPVLSTSHSYAPQKVSVAPNPFRQRTVLRFPFALVDEALLLRSMNGQVLRSFTLHGDVFELQREGLPAGLYFLEFPSGILPMQRVVVR